MMLSRLSTRCGGGRFSASATVAARQQQQRRTLTGAVVCCFVNNGVVGSRSGSKSVGERNVFVAARTPCYPVRLQQHQQRSFSPTTSLHDEELPYHLVVGLPALRCVASKLHKVAELVHW